MDCQWNVCNRYYYYSTPYMVLYSLWTFMASAVRHCSSGIRPWKLTSLVIQSSTTWSSGGNCCCSSLAALIHSDIFLATWDTSNYTPTCTHGQGYTSIAHLFEGTVQPVPQHRIIHSAVLPQLQPGVHSISQLGQQWHVMGLSCDGFLPLVQA